MESVFQHRAQGIFLTYPVSYASHGLCQLNKIRIGKVSVRSMPISIHLFPSNQPISIIMENQHNKGKVFPSGRFKLLHVHHKAAISCYSENPRIRENKASGKRTWQGDA